MSSRLSFQQPAKEYNLGIYPGMSDSDYLIAMRRIFDEAAKTYKEQLIFTEWCDLPRLMLNAKRIGNVEICSSEKDTQINNFYAELAI